MAPRPLPQVGPHPPPNHSTLQWHTTMAPRPLPRKLVITLPLHHSTTMAPAMGPRPLPRKLVITLPLHHSTTMAPAMGPRPLPRKLVITLPLHHSTAMAPAMGPRPLPRKLVITLPPTIAHYNGTLQWHPAMAPRPLPRKLVITLPLHHSTAMAPAMGPRPLHPAKAPWCLVQSAKVVRRPPPLLEVRTPIAIAIWGKTNPKWQCRTGFAHSFRLRSCRTHLQPEQNTMETQQFNLNHWFL